MPSLILGNVDRVSTVSGMGEKLIVNLEGVGEADILQHVDISQAISFYGEAALLGRIGKDKIIKHFNIKEK